MRDINIVLLGETGVGKTTFVNGILNYLFFEKTEDVMGNIVVPAPLTFHVFNHVNKRKTIELNQYKNADAKEHEYFIPLQDSQLRIIDLPGCLTNNDDLAYSLSQLGHLEQLHAVCFFLKSSLSRLNTIFEYCIRHTVSTLDAPIVKNFIFIFTHARTVRFDPSVAKSVLQGFVESVRSKPPYVEVPLSADNIFCVENDAFLNLAAEERGVRLHPQVKAETEESWRFSQQQCKRLVEYVLKIQPYQFPQLEIVNSIEQFFEENTSTLCAIVESSFRGKEVIKNMTRQATTATKLLEKLKQELLAVKSSSMQNTYAEAVGSSSSSNRNTVKGNKRNSVPKTGYNKDGAKTYDKNPNHKTTEATMPFHASNVTLEQLTNITAIMKDQEEFIQGIHSHYRTHDRNKQVLLENIAKCSVYLEQNGREDVFTNKISFWLTTSKQNSDSQSERIWEELLQNHTNMKDRISETGKVELEPKDIPKITKDLEKLQHYQELYNAILKIE